MDDDGVYFGTCFLFGFALNIMKSDGKKVTFPLQSEANFRGRSKYTRLSGPPSVNEGRAEMAPLVRSLHKARHICQLFREWSHALVKPLQSDDHGTGLTYVLSN